jgi:hypothetical protein
MDAEWGMQVTGPETASAEAPRHPTGRGPRRPGSPPGYARAVVGPLLHNLGATATLALGLLGLVAPRRAAALLGLVPEGLLGLSELRATYGGLFAALGAFTLLAQDQVAFALLGAAWLGAAAARLGSAWLDRSRETRNYAGAIVEGSLAILLLVPL